MPTAVARIETERPSRYLVQICRHAAAMGGASGHRPRMHFGGGAPALPEVKIAAEWSESRGVLSFEPWGRCTIEAAANTLLLHAEAGDEDDLRRIQDILTADLDRFGRRDRLTVSWERPEAGD